MKDMLMQNIGSKSSKPAKNPKEAFQALVNK